MLTNQFEKFVEQNNLFEKKDTLLLALSGGCDSVALFHLLKTLNYKFSAVHCNFNLRNTDSDKDELFVTELCNKYNIPLFKSSFNTKKFAAENKLSIEDTARKLRYREFEKIRKKNGFSYILTAHHLDDKIETFFINLTKGTGIKGLRSIKPKNNKLIRPLLFAKKEEIEEYCTKNMIKYRTDQSNYDTNFLRNRFRHLILPAFQEINPGFKESMQKNFKIFTDLENIYTQYIETEKNNLTENVNNLIYIDLKKLLNATAPSTLLFEILRLYGFNSSQSSDIFQNINNLQTGKIFYSKTNRLLKVPDFLIIDKLKQKDNESFCIESHISEIDNPVKLSFEQTAEIPKILKTDNQTAYFNFDKISFPLILRRAENADYFYPFGMKGKKMLSDFFTDKKINLFERENIWLLTTSKDEILWVVSYRTDDRFKITEKSKMALIIKQL